MEADTMHPNVQMRDVWTVADLDALDVPDWWRYEIVDGALVVSPSGGGTHELVGEDLRAAIRAVLPAGMVVVGPIGVAIGSSHLVPDLVVAERSRVRGVPYLQPSDVLLAVEVVSPGSVTMDRVTKPAKYAGAGIGHYWRVETVPISLSAYELAAGSTTYREVVSWREGDVVELAEPFAVTFPIAELAR